MLTLVSISNLSKTHAWLMLTRQSRTLSNNNHDSHDTACSTVTSCRQSVTQSIKQHITIKNAQVEKKVIKNYFILRPDRPAFSCAKNCMDSECFEYCFIIIFVGTAVNDDCVQYLGQSLYIFISINVFIYYFTIFLYLSHRSAQLFGT